jgi:Leucine-rich repeat (LRR) protein
MKTNLFFMLLLLFVQVKAQVRDSIYITYGELLGDIWEGLNWPDKRYCDTCYYPCELDKIVELRFEQSSPQEEEILLTILPQLTELRVVNIWHIPTRYIEFFQELEKLDKLEYVAFRCFPYNDIDDLDFPFMVKKLKNIKYLSITSCRLSTIPPEIGELTKLEQLSFMDNDFTEFPKELGNLLNLKVLRVGVRSSISERYTSRVRHISESVLSLPNLEELTILSIGLREIPCALMDMPKLKRVRLSKNDYVKEIPECIDKDKFEYFSAGYLSMW